VPSPTRSRRPAASRPTAVEPLARVESIGRLDAEDLRQVSLLVERATEADGVRPLSEHVSLHLRSGGDTGARHLLVHVPDAGPEGDRLAGYGHLDTSDAVDGSSAELAVDPDLRGRRIGRLLVRHLLAGSPDGRLRLWAHGDLPGARRLAEELGFTSSRRLEQRRRSLLAPLQTTVLPAGVTLRPFVPGVDDAAWVALNSAAFAGHPEQGRWSLEDLRVRLREPWADPAGFLLAERAGRLVGFHWTKVHGQDTDPDAARGHGHGAIGEVYVAGVDPAARGLGLGRALVVAGLELLRARGLPEAMLYVDADNRAAIALYESLGFTRWNTDVSYRRQVT
jgi:mycothiol synthase